MTDPEKLRMLADHFASHLRPFVWPDGIGEVQEDLRRIAVFIERLHVITEDSSRCWMCGEQVVFRSGDEKISQWECPCGNLSIEKRIRQVHPLTTGVPA